MQIAKNKTMATLIALFLISAMAISLVALPTANAAGTMKTYPFIGAMPNPVGVGQETLIHVGITLALQSAEMGWEGLTVIVTRPDGTTETLGPIKTDSTGGTGRVYVPATAGNYTLQTHFPEQMTTATKVGRGTPANTTMLASDSAKLTLVVQQEPIGYYPGVPLPTEYWTRPIDAQAREWSVIAGNWLDGGRRNPKFVTGNDDAPETAHILWARPETQGGLVGDPLGQRSFEPGDAYEGKFASRFILGGRLYYNIYAGPSSGDVDIYREYVCVDLHTGEELWSKVFLDNLTLSFGQLMFWDTYDNQGIYDYLWATANAATLRRLGLNASLVGTTWCAFDAFTGDYVYTLTNMPSGTQVYGPKGEILIYTFNYNAGYITLWNSTNIPALYASTAYAAMAWGQWRPYGKIVNATGPVGVTFGGLPFTAPTTPLGLNGYQWNVSIADNPGKRSVPGSVQALFTLDKAIGASLSTTQVRLWGLNLKPGKEGQLLFNNTWNAPADWAAGNVTVDFNVASSEDGVYVLWTAESLEYYGFSLETGAYLWGPSEPEQYLNFYGWTAFGERPVLIAYGKMYSSGVSGIVYCRDVKTGKTLWTYEVNDPYTEILWANNWWQFPLFITDGKVYYGHLEHSANQPLPRGAPFICLNATTGEVIWRANGLFRQTLWGGLGIIGDSIIATQDTYDQRIYAIGKGPSATTVTAAPEVSVHGSSVLVKGMVTDTSPGTKDAGLTMRFPNGVPAVADASMSDWMLYVYKQFPRPANASGVEVSLDTVDPNGNFVHIGTATSDASGMFSYQWAPDVPGKYTVIATFAGSGAYYASYSETAIGVDEAPPAPAAPEPPAPLPPYETYTIGTGIAIIAAVAIATILLLRKKP